MGSVSPVPTPPRPPSSAGWAVAAGPCPTPNLNPGVILEGPAGAEAFGRRHWPQAGLRVPARRWEGPAGGRWSQGSEEGTWAPVHAQAQGLLGLSGDVARRGAQRTFRGTRNRLPGGRERGRAQMCTQGGPLRVSIGPSQGRRKHLGPVCLSVRPSPSLSPSSPPSLSEDFLSHPHLAGAQGFQ